MNIKNTLSNRTTFTLFALILLLVAGCSRKVAPPAPATQTPAGPLLEVTYCDINPSDLCLQGFGLDRNERLLILFKTVDPQFAAIYIRAEAPEGEIPFECLQSESLPENIYCLGESVDEKELIKLNIYSKSSNELIAIGVFNVQFASLPEPDVVFGVDATPTPSPVASYPNPSTPTPSYPNPTSAP